MRILIWAFILGLTACITGNDRKRFFGYPNEVTYIGNLNENREEFGFEFFTVKGERLSAGNYLNGFRNEKWFYKIQDSLIEIKWAHFKDKNLGFETNIFAIADTVYYGDYYTKIDYTFGNGKLSFGVIINAPFKDSVNTIGYKNVAKMELKSMNYILNQIDTAIIQDIRIYSLSATNTKEQKKLYTNVAFGKIGKDHIQITVVSNKDVKKEYNDIFFEGVLTNLFYKSKRFYFPFK